MDYNELSDKQIQLKSALRDLEDEYAKKLEALHADMTACVLAMGYGDYGDLLDKWYVHKDEGLFFYPVSLTANRGFFEAVGIAIDTLVFMDASDSLIYEHTVMVSALGDQWKPSGLKKVVKQLESRLEFILGQFPRPNREYLRPALAEALKENTV